MPPKKTAAKASKEAGEPATKMKAKGKKVNAKAELSDVENEVHTNGEDAEKDGPSKAKKKVSEMKVAKATKAKPKKAAATKAEDSDVEENEVEANIDEDFENDDSPSKSMKKKTAMDKAVKERRKMPSRSVKQTEPREPEFDEPKVKKAKKTKKDAIEGNENKLKNQTSSKFDESFDCTKKNKNGEAHNMTISSWNVDGVRAWLKKGGLEYLKHEKPDVFCLQETKCNESKLPDELKNIDGYKTYWLSSDKDGYAGVSFFSKIEPVSVSYGIDNEDFDAEGRCITIELNQVYIVNAYVPNAGRKLITLPKRLEWNDLFKEYVKELDKKKPVIICGDMNVAHNEIDLTNPKANIKNAGFTKEEREGLTDLLGSGFIDTFRNLYPDKEDAYTFWTYMMKARERNVGWRLDYFIISERLMDNVCDTVIRDKVFGSDHCPITLFIHI